MENKSFKINGIKLLMKNYNLTGDELDLNTLVDNSLSMKENWKLIKPKVLLLSNNNHYI